MGAIDIQKDINDLDREEMELDEDGNKKPIVALREASPLPRRTHTNEDSMVTRS